MTVPTPPLVPGLLHGALLVRHPSHPEIFAIYPNGLRCQVLASEWLAAGSPTPWVLDFGDNVPGGQEDQEFLALRAYDKALRA